MRDSLGTLPHSYNPCPLPFYSWSVQTVKKKEDTQNFTCVVPTMNISHQICAWYLWCGLFIGGTSLSCDGQSKSQDREVPTMSYIPARGRRREIKSQIISHTARSFPCRVEWITQMPPTGVCNVLNHQCRRVESNTIEAVQFLPLVQWFNSTYVIINITQILFISSLRSQRARP